MVQFNIFTEMAKSFDHSLPFMNPCLVNQLKTSGWGFDVSYDGFL